MTRADYNLEVDQRHGHQAKWVLRDARRNWHVFEEVREDLLEWVKLYHRDSWLNVGEKCHSADGTLTGLGWLAGRNLHQLIDFEENLQTCFLRRGLVSYLKLLLRDVEAAGIEVVPEGQFELPIAECGLRIDETGSGETHASTVESASRRLVGETGSAGTDASTFTNTPECGEEAGR